MAVIWNASPFPKPSPVLEDDYYLEAPPPLGVPIEPVELKESELRLAQIVTRAGNSRQAPPRGPRLSLLGIVGWVGVALLCCPFSDACGQSQMIGDSLFILWRFT